MKGLRNTLTVFFLLIYAAAFSQDSGIDLESLTIPSSPAASIMGEQPIEVTRPKNLSQLESSLISNFSDGANLILPDGLALEFMPYWLKPKPGIEYDRKKDEKYQWKPLQNLALSVATINRMQGDSLFRSQVGFGFRTLLLNGKMSSKDMDKLDALKRDYMKATELRTIIGGITSKLMSGNSNTVSKTELADTLKSRIAYESVRRGKSDKEREFLVNWALSELDKFVSSGGMASEQNLGLHLAAANAGWTMPKNIKTVAEIAKESQELRVKRYGWRWEVAGATFLDFPTQQISFTTVPQLGLWTNMSYTIPSGKAYFIMMARYIRDFQFNHELGDGSGANNLDAGFSIVWDIGRFSLTGEGILRNVRYTLTETNEEGWVRSQPESEIDYRLTVNASFRISEKILISYSFGKSFNSQQPDHSAPLINQLSINFGFGDVPLKL